MGMQTKEISLILVIALGLSAAALGLAPVITTEPPTNVVAAITNSPTPDQVKQGASLFGRNCAHCHGDDAHGDEGPDLHGLTKSDARITKIIKEGIKGEMPKFQAKFSDADIQALIAFLRTLKD
jgi:mono/diheme cytochrome c family protein